ncbi:MAG: hypothetical protein OXG53_16430 [Chloroflexi bacterium]|nr:hypothetical protein [Chloroflexota bacterium]
MEKNHVRRSEIISRPPPPRIFVLSLFSLLIFSLSATPVSAATITVNRTSADIADDDACSLAEALINANNDAQTHDDCAAGSGDDTINLTGNVTLPDGNRLRISDTLTINGNGHTLSGPGDLLQANGVSVTDTLTLTINRLTLTNNNSTTANNGALEMWDGVTLVVNNSKFIDNSANDDSGAAIEVRSAGRNVTINNSIFSGNVAKERGGAIFSSQSGSTITISNSTFSDNESETDGGAIFVRSGVTLNISDSSFSGNEAGTSGGAIGANLGNTNLSITNSVFTENSATNVGGAISQGAPATIVRSVFYDNESNDKGGAIFSTRNLRLENSTFYDNEALNEGGALGSDDFWAQTVNIRHVTFVNNEATGTGKNGNSVFMDTNISANMYNSIIKEKSGAGGTDCAGLDTNTNNIIEDGSCSTSSTYSVNPLLGGRAGSPAYYTLRANSPAIDAANAAACSALNEAVDQRSRARPYGLLCDIGAFEWYPPPPRPPDSGDDDDDDDGEPAPTPMPGPRCGFCADLLAKGYRLRARYGLESGVQFRRVDRDGIGVQSALDAGFRDAVDVYGYAEQGVEVCFPAAGSLILLDATTSPRAPASVPGYTREGRTCAAIDRPGTLVLVDNPPAGLPILTTSVTFAAPAPVAEAVGSGYQQLHSCMVTTPGLIRFRDAPGGAPLLYTDPWGRQENGWLPGYVTLTALERTPDWFKVDYYGTRGWVSAHHVTTHGVCG